eukprot:8125138-Lingulodinium_polyedra.AAC.1
MFPLPDREEGAEGGCRVSQAVGLRGSRRSLRRLGAAVLVLVSGLAPGAKKLQLEFGNGAFARE